ncbi:MAG: pilus assembly protein PilM [Candidatus Paceibacterota bacterium]|jgi:Tfp pilus assembly PilM family ATPase
MFISKEIFSKYFPPPKFLMMPFVGIDISPLTIRFVEILERPSLRIGRHQEVRLKEPFSISEGNHEEVKEILRKWKKEHGLKYVKSTIPEDKAYLFEAEIPYSSDENMRNSIEFILEENVPLSGPDAIFDYRIAGEGEKKGYSRVVVTVLPRTIIEAYSSLFEECELVPLSFIIEPQAFSRALIQRGDQNTYLIVNIGETKTCLFVVSQENVEFTSTLSLGSNDFTKAIIKELNVSPEEAFNLKKTKGFSREGDQEVLSAIISTASVFRQEVDKVYDYWQTYRGSKNPSEKISKIILSGKDALILGFGDYLSQNTKIQTVIGNILENFGSSEKKNPTLSPEESLDWAGAVGVAILNGK